MKNERGFTLIEMLVVLLIISVLILVTIPNVTKHFATVDDKGCSAYMKMVQGQVEAYKIETKEYPSIQQLVDNDYLQNDNQTCPNGENIQIVDGEVQLTSGTTGNDSP